MKFKEAEKSKPIKIYKESLKQKKRISNTITNIYSYDLFGSVSVILMKLETKGNFKYISTLVNDGKQAASWTIRVYYTKGKWNAQVAPHPSIKRDDINISIVDFLEKNIKDDDIKLLANTHMGTVSSSDGHKIENIVNILINKLRNEKFKNVESFELFSKYKKKSSNKKFVLDMNTNSEEILIDSLKKYIHILLSLLKKEITDEERNKLKKMINKELDKENKNYLIELSHKYFNQSERIKMAMNYILK